MPVDARPSAVEYHALAVEQYNLGAPARALRTLRRGLSALDADHTLDPHERDVVAARIWTSIALNESEMRSFEQSASALTTAEQFADRADDPQVRVLLHCQRGLIEMRRGRLGDARVSLDAAVGLIEHAGPRDRANILLNRGTVGLLDGRLRAARADLTWGARIAEDARLDVEAFKTLHNLAYLEFLAGDLPRALRLMQAAADVNADVSRGVWYLDRARVLVEAGLPREADESLARAAGILARARLGQDLAETMLERARCALAINDASAARRFAREAGIRFRRRGNERWRRAAELVLLQADLAERRAPLRLAERAAALAAELQGERLRLPARAATLIAAEALLVAGQLEAATAALGGIGHSRPDDPITGRMHSHYVHARVAAARGRTADATRRIRRALDELARYQASFGSIDLRTAAAVHGRGLAELDIALALERGHPAVVFAAAERARAVAARLPAIRPPDDPVAADLLAELRQTVEALRGVEQDRVASTRLLRERRDLERRIVARTWAVPGDGSILRPASLDDVRVQLAQRERSMVVYIQAGDALAALTIGARLRVHRLGAAAPLLESIRRVRADLDVLAQPRLPGPLRAAARSSLRRSLGSLDEALVVPLDVAGPLVLISTGVLGQLPWASLPSLRSRSLVVAPSATKWLASTTGSTARTRVAAIAGPDLPRARSEVEIVGRAWSGADVLTDRDAGAQTLAQLMGTVDVLHVAAHGVHQPENPLFSSLRLADGPVFAHELDQHGRAPEHVVLSACEVGLATIRPGDEALGLASVLLGLGTRSVIASVARVGDEVAEATMASYHARLAAGSDSSAALAEALTDVDADVVPPFVNFGAAWRPSA